MSSCVPGDALAHASLPGSEGFYLRLLHPLSAPSQILSLLSLGVAVGFCAREKVVLPIAVFAVLLLLGVIAGQFRLTLPWGELGLLLCAALAGTLAAVQPEKLFVPSLMLAVIIGFLLGVLSTPDPGPLQATVVTLAGSLVAACFALLYVAGAVGWTHERFAQPWVKIGLRIIAAWLAAVSLLMAALVYVSLGEIPPQ